MKQFFIASLFLFTSSMISMAQERIELHPGAKMKIGGAQAIQDAPYFEYFRSQSKDRKTAAVLICPGGAYTNLAVNHEGKDVALFFNEHGYDAFVLHYRLNDGQQSGSTYPAQWDDATTALRYIKQHAASWQIDPSKVGILGFSAGGHLASSVATIIDNGDGSADKPSTRPAFAVLVYPVISLNTNFKHAYSAEMLLGKDYSKQMADSLSTNLRISDQTPPTFLVHSTDDKTVPVENSWFFYQGLKQHGISAGLHIFDHGGHGYGMAPKDKVLNAWPKLCIDWLEEQGL